MANRGAKPIKRSAGETPRQSDAQAWMMFEACKTSVTAAFLLWFFLGMFGGHRFYLGRYISAVIMLLLTLTVFGACITGIWWLIDAFLIPGMARDNNLALANELGRPF